MLKMERGNTEEKMETMRNDENRGRKHKAENETDGG